MTRRRDLEHHRHSLAEIRDIMNSMKTLAYMETRKLARFCAAQQAVVYSIRQAAADLVAFHPPPRTPVAASVPLYLLIGTERGFCGDFNHVLLRHLETTLQNQTANHPRLIGVGRKLCTLLEDDARVVAMIDGATVGDEVPALLDQVVNEITVAQDVHGIPAVHCLYHDSDAGVAERQLLPPFQDLPHTPQHHGHPPMLNLPPAALLAELADHFLFAALHEMLYTSLMVENHYRITHLEGAMKHLDKQWEELGRQCNALRQEEIVEEIEVILLNAANLSDPAQRGHGDTRRDGQRYTHD